LKQTGELPGGRSGHSLTFIGNSNYLLYGGIENSKDGKIAPNPDCYVMKMTPGKYTHPHTRHTGHTRSVWLGGAYQITSLSLEPSIIFVECLRIQVYLKSPPF